MNLNRLAYFAAVVDAGSFTRAAERLGITKAVVSQQVARLERDVGTTLLIRTTRRVHPTEAGRTFHARCLNVLQQAEDAFDELAQAAAEPTGTLRIAAPNDYGTSAVVPVVAAFSARYPACRVELTLGDETIDLASGGMDVAIRVGWLADSSLQARRIGTFRQFMVCGAEFAGRFKAGEPQDLAGLPFVANMALREPLLWQFSRGDEHEQTCACRQRSPSTRRRQCWRPSAPAPACRCCRIFWCGMSWPQGSSSTSCPSGGCPPEASTQSTPPHVFGRPR